MSNCKWYEIDSIASPYDAASFETYLARQVADGDAEEVQAAKNHDEGNAKCFRWKHTGDIWRFVPPQGTTRGCWQPILSAP